MAMRLDRLGQLHKDMLQQKIIKQKFQFQFRNLQFSVIYIAEDFPHNLLFGCIASELFFVIEVNSSYEISTYLHDNYPLLLKALNLKNDPDNPFSPSVFFRAFGQLIPTNAYLRSIPTMKEVAELSQDIDEASKIYFCGWRTHDGVTSRPTLQNLQKTLRCCGSNAYQICLNHMISSCWTDDVRNQRLYFEPNI